MALIRRSDRPSPQPTQTPTRPDAESIWTEDSVRALADPSDSRFQNVALPYGLSTGGRDRAPTAHAIFPEDLRGKTVLDVGCRVGYFCFEAARRGAARVVGIDWNARAIARARELADCLGLDVEFRLADADQELPSESFDYVLCLNLLHHLRDPLAALERMGTITRDRLALEVAGFGWNDRANLGISWPLGLLLARLPVLYVAPTGLRKRRAIERFYVSGPALRNLLLRHRPTFARVDTLRSPLKRRMIALAYKRRIGDLVVVAGPLGGGQHELCRRLLGGGMPALAQQIGIGDASAWRCVRGRDLPELDLPMLPKLLLHYDFPELSLDAGEDPLGVIACAERVTFVTLWSSADVLKRRIDALGVSASTRRGNRFEGRRYQWIRRAYQDPVGLRATYEAWFTRVQSHPQARHLLVSGDDGRGVSWPPTDARSSSAAGVTGS